MRCKLRQEVHSFEERCNGFQKAFSHQELDAQQQSMVQQQAALQSQVFYSSLPSLPFLQLCLAAVHRCGALLACVAVVRGAEGLSEAAQLVETEALLAATHARAHELRAKLHELARERDSLKQLLAGDAPYFCPFSLCHMHTHLLHLVALLEEPLSVIHGVVQFTHSFCVQSWGEVQPARLQHVQSGTQ